MTDTKPIEPSVEPLRGWLAETGHTKPPFEQIEDALAAYDQLKAENEALKSGLVRLEGSHLTRAVGLLKWQLDATPILTKCLLMLQGDDHQTTLRLLGVKP